MMLLVVAGWLALGLAAVAVMRRRGHDTFEWGVLFMFLGPLALPLAVSADRQRPPQPDAPIREGRLDVLVAHDGSAGAAAAVRATLELLGPQVTSLTVAAVIDLEAASTVRGRETQRDAQARLDAVASDLAGAVTTAPVDTVILFGEPAHALQDFAAEHGYELIVAAPGSAGGPGHGRRATGRLAAASPVPVLIAGTPAPHPT